MGLHPARHAVIDSDHGVVLEQFVGDFDEHPDTRQDNQSTNGEVQAEVPSRSEAILKKAQLTLEAAAQGCDPRTGAESPPAAPEIPLVAHHPNPEQSEHDNEQDHEAKHRRPLFKLHPPCGQRS
jgi:hypothetical protein